VSSHAVQAQQAQQAPATAAAAAPQKVYETGEVYLPGSRVYTFVGKTGFGHEHAVIGQLKNGHIRLDAPRESGELVFDMTTFAADADVARQYLHLPGTTDASTQQQVNVNMLGTAVLDVARYPTATFTIHSITSLTQPSSRGLPQYQLAGDFTLHGATRPLSMSADAEQQGGWTHLRGQFTMLQSAFGITPFSKAFGAVGVCDQLTVYGDIWIAKDRQVAQNSSLQR
jgi:polyisoprenoid-binding protein YceI